MKKIEDRMNLLKNLIDDKISRRDLPLHVVDDSFLINLFAIAQRICHDDNFAGRGIEYAYEFSKWEQRNVFSGGRSYEEFRDKYGLDWDEILEDFVEFKEEHVSKWKFDENRIKNKSKND